MSKALCEWVDCDVRPYRDKPVRWLSEEYCFRDPSRAIFSDTGCFLSPADGIIVYQKRVGPDEPVVDIKGKPYSIRDALREPRFAHECLVIGIFMTFFDVHVNRIPYAGRLWYRELEPIDTFNQPMLDVEIGLCEELHIDVESMGYLHQNQRLVNRVFATPLDLNYYILQIADYDVDCITPFELKQGQVFNQGQRFSQIRYGSQVDLIVPVSARYDFQFLQQTSYHVEAGIDPLLRVAERSSNDGTSQEDTNALHTSSSNGNTKRLNGSGDESHDAGPSRVRDERSILAVNGGGKQHLDGGVH